MVFYFAIQVSSSVYLSVVNNTDPDSSSVAIRWIQIFSSYQLFRPDLLVSRLDRCVCKHDFVSSRLPAVTSLAGW